MFLKMTECVILPLSTFSNVYPPSISRRLSTKFLHLIKTKSSFIIVNFCLSLFVMQTEIQQPPVYFAVGPQPHDISCPFCKQYSKTIMKRSILRCCLRRHYCSQCGEYLGSYRRPQL